MKKKKTKLHIYLFRHGQTTYNRDGRFTGQSEAKLTAKGKKQANIIAKKLKNKKIDVAFQTQLSRSKDTLKPILKTHPEIRELITANRMIERSYGDLEGSTHDSFIKKIGEQAYDLRREGDAIENLEPKQRKEVEKFLGEQSYKTIHRGWDTPPPHGESFKMIEKRVKIFIKNLKAFMKKEKVNVAISAHGNSIRLFRKIMEKASIKETVKWFIPYDRVFHYTIEV